MMHMILAVDRANKIGWSTGELPWKLPVDMRRFKELTTGQIVVMGHNTFKSLNRPNGLPNRRNFILTRANYADIKGQYGDVEVISDLSYFARFQEPVWVCGGAQIYNDAIDRQLIDVIHLTIVDQDTGADVAVKHDFAAWKLFILSEQKRGIIWNLDDIQEAQDGSTNLKFLTLRKV